MAEHECKLASNNGQVLHFHMMNPQHPDDVNVLYCKRITNSKALHQNMDACMYFRSLLSLLIFLCAYLLHTFYYLNWQKALWLHSSNTLTLKRP